MSLDYIQTLNNTYERVVKDKDPSSNSIKFRLLSLKAAKEKAFELTKDVVEAYSDAGVSDEKIQEIVKDYAEYVAKLENKIRVLSGEQGPIELVGTRAIRLVDKMIKAAKENSKGVYTEFAKVNNDDTAVEKSPIAVEKTNDENTSIAINKEESLENDDIKDIFDEALKEVVTEPIIEPVVEKNSFEEVATEPITEAVTEKNPFEGVATEPITEAVTGKNPFEGIATEPITEAVVEKNPFEEEKRRLLKEIEERRQGLTFESNEIKRKINSKIDEYMAQEAKEKVVEDEDEYVPMTDEEIAAARQEIENVKYQELNKDEKSTEAVVSEVVIPEVKPVEVPVQEVKAEREEVVVAPEREMVPEFTVVQESNAEPKSVVVSSSEKEEMKNYSVEDLLKKVNDSKKAKALKELEKSQAIKEKEESEKRRAEKEAAFAIKEEEVKKALIEQIYTIDSANSTLDSDIESAKAQTANIDKESEDIDKRMAELDMMFGEVSQEEDKQKTM